MNAENNVARGGRDVDAPVEQAGFQMPLELARQYQVRVIQPADGSERRVGMFLSKDRDVPSIEVGGNGDRIVANNEDPETIGALVKIARHNRWEGIDVEGSAEFRQAVWEAASREGLKVRGYDPKFGEQERIEELRRADVARRMSETVEKPGPSAESVALAPLVELGDATILGIQAEPEPQVTREKREHDAAAERQHGSEELAELFLHGGAERIASEPRLANALVAQATMDTHLKEAFDGDADRMSAASLESRQMISDVLRRGLDVSVREPTPVRQIEPPQQTPDLER